MVCRVRSNAPRSIYPCSLGAVARTNTLTHTDNSFRVTPMPRDIESWCRCKYLVSGVQTRPPVSQTKFDHLWILHCCWPSTCNHSPPDMPCLPASSRVFWLTDTGRVAEGLPASKAAPARRHILRAGSRRRIVRRRRVPWRPGRDGRRRYRDDALVGWRLAGDPN